MSGSIGTTLRRCLAVALCAAGFAPTSAQAAPSITVGPPVTVSDGRMTVTATVSGLGESVSGTVTFRVTPYVDATCLGAYFTSVKPLARMGLVATATSDPFTIDSRHGVYLMVTYDGDAASAPVSTTCRSVFPAPGLPFRRGFVVRISAITTPTRSRIAPHGFTSRGRIDLPETYCSAIVMPTLTANCMPRMCPPAGFELCLLVTRAMTCRGVVTVRLQRHGRTISSRDAPVRPDCTYRSRAIMRAAWRGTILVTARFMGNAYLRPLSSRTRTVYLE